MGLAKDSKSSVCQLLLNYSFAILTRRLTSGRSMATFSSRSLEKTKPYSVSEDIQHLLGVEACLLLVPDVNDKTLPNRLSLDKNRQTIRFLHCLNFGISP